MKPIGLTQIRLVGLKPVGLRLVGLKPVGLKQICLKPFDAGFHLKILTDGNAHPGLKVVGLRCLEKSF